MPTQVKVIIGKNKVYATYGKLICFEATYNGIDTDTQSFQDIVRNAQAIAFAYAVGYSNCGTVSVNFVRDNSITNSDDLFDYLEKCHA
jgi:hypothetical protein